ncbi:MAG: EAL domain-containing protein [Lachnospiraceae bacterium]|nr:EAL domain-containing protein [Lachnospiraceae bacterium]
MEEKAIVQQRVKFICLAVLFCTLVASESLIISGFGITEELEFLVNLLGVLTVLQILIAIFLVTISKEGYYYVMILFALETVIVAVKMAFAKEMLLAPMLAMILLGICVQYVIHRLIISLTSKEEQVEEMSHKDVLTDLPNRRSVKEHMDELIASHCEHYAVAIIDIDNFKNVNDTAGHESGDEVLGQIAERWKDLLGENDFLARLGGDEFAVVIYEYESLESLDRMLGNILSALSEKFVLKDRDYYLTASMGVAFYPGDSVDASQSLKYADMAMYVAKKQGRNQQVYFNSIMNDAIEKNVKLETIIRGALEANAFTLLYQPQFRTTDKKLRGFETLIRMWDINGMPVSPAEFIPIAEQSSLIKDVDRWVLSHAMFDFMVLVEKNPDLVLSINISALHLLDENFLNDLDEVLEMTKFPTACLELELTETVMVESVDHAKEVLQQIKERGIQIALDDFGTGYSSLKYLKDLPIDLLKIDKTFVDSINDKKDESFIAAIISLSQIMNFAVISEGVEEEYQRQLLADLGCDYIQGFLWSRPLMLEDARKLIFGIPVRPEEPKEISPPKRR